MLLPILSWLLWIGLLVMQFLGCLVGLLLHLELQNILTFRYSWKIARSELLSSIAQIVTYSSWVVPSACSSIHVLLSYAPIYIVIEQHIYAHAFPSTWIVHCTPFFFGLANAKMGFEVGGGNGNSHCYNASSLSINPLIFATASTILCRSLFLNPC